MKPKVYESSHNSSRTTAIPMRPLFVAIALLVSPFATNARSPVEHDLQESPTEKPGPSQAAPTQLQSVVVTARKQAELLQDVPLTVYAFSDADLENIAPKSLFDMTILSPGLNYQEIGSGRGGSRIQMRGISGGSTGESRASVFLDGIYLTGNVQNIPFQFMERVEVIPGPQSSQFGRSTFAGAINYVTKQPPKQFGGTADLTMGTLGEKEAYVSIGGPITSTIRGVAYVWNQGFKGDYKSVQGAQLATTLTKALGGKFVFDPGNGLYVDLSSYYSRDWDGTSIAQWLDPAKRATDPIFKPYLRADGTEALWVTGKLPSIPFDPKNASRTINSLANHLRDRRRALRSSIHVNYLTSGGYSLSFNGGSFSERTSPGQRATSLMVHTLMDFIGNPYYGLDWSTSHSNVTSGEFRISSPEENAFRYSVGAFYQKLDTPNIGLTFGRNSCLTICTLDILGAYRINTTNVPTDTDQNAKDRSLFASIAYDFSDRMTASLEGRIQREYISSNNFVSGLQIDGTWQAFLPRLNLQFRATDDIQFYALYSVGNNPGTFNTSQYLGLPGTGTRLSQRQVNEEKLLNYEAGMKSSWLDNSLMVNVTLYHQLWNDMQVPQVYFTPDGRNTFSVIENRGSAKIDGLEVVAQWVPLPGLNLRGSLSYNNGKYLNYCSGNYAALLGRSDMAAPNACLFVNGKHLENVPAETHSLSADYTRALFGNWTWFARGSYQHQSRMWTEEWNSSWSEGATVFTAAAGVSNGRLRAELYCRNCGQEDAPVRVGRSTDFRLGVSRPGNFAPGYFLRRPRQFGLHVTYDF